MTDYQRGVTDAIHAIVDWHREQGRNFRTHGLNLERRLSPEDEHKFHWAAASHNAHADHIANHRIPRIRELLR